MPVAFVNSGSRYPNRPDSSVEVVEATVMNGCCATAADATGRNADKAMHSRTQAIMSPPPSFPCCL